MKFKFDKKIICIFLVILIFLLILVLENKESFSLGGESKMQRGKRKLKKKMKIKLTEKEQREEIEAKGAKEAKEAKEATEAKEAKEAKEATTLNHILKLDSAVRRDKSSLEYKGIGKRAGFVEDNDRRTLTVKAIKDLGLTKSNVKNMKKLLNNLPEEKKKQIPQNSIFFNYSNAREVRPKLNIDKVLNNRSNFSKLKDLVMRRNKKYKADKEKENAAKISAIEKQITNKEQLKARNNERLKADARRNNERLKADASKKIQKIFRERQAIIQARKIVEGKKKERNSSENLQQLGELTALSINQNMERAKERAEAIQELEKHELIGKNFDVNYTIYKFKKQGKGKEHIDLYLNKLREVADAYDEAQSPEFKEKRKSLSKEERELVISVIKGHLFMITKQTQSFENNGVTTKINPITSRGERVLKTVKQRIEDMNQLLKNPELMTVLDGTTGFTIDKIEESKKQLEDLV